jgi:hypothetical protein
MTRRVTIVNITLCGPGDVAKEIEIADDEVREWNRLHSEAAGFVVKARHWSTDTYPELGDRPQAIINRRIIDDADILVAVFWSRLGMPTGTAASGTEEEIRRGVAQDKKVMVYFSNVEPLPSGAETAQLRRLETFRDELRSQGLYWSFASRKAFRDQFRGHLAMVLNDFRARAATPTADAVVNQAVSGNGNVVAGRDVNFYPKPPVQRTVLERRPGAVTAAEARQLQQWIADLADGTTGKARSDAFAEWQERFRNRFRLARYDELESRQMTEAESWHREQKAIQTRGLKRKSPDDWSRSRKTAIKAAMTRMERSNDDYYPELSRRLRLKRPFKSLNDLTKRDLDRVYNMVGRDARES